MWKGRISRSSAMRARPYRRPPGRSCPHAGRAPERGRCRRSSTRPLRRPITRPLGSSRAAPSIMPAMRVIAGRYGGRRLQAPPGDATRPTSDRVREALFSILGDRVEGARVLDLFAGSGALGLEALSRGAASATFVDSAPAAIRAVKANLAALGAEAEVVRADALRWLRGAPPAARQHDLV